MVLEPHKGGAQAQWLVENWQALCRSTCLKKARGSDVPRRKARASEGLGENADDISQGT